MRTSSLFHLLLGSLVFAGHLYAQPWTKITPVFDPPGSYRTYNGIFVDRYHGWWISRMPESELLATTDGGLSWQKLADSIALEHIEFTDTLHGWMSGIRLWGGMCYLEITKDGGRSWQSHPTRLMTSLVMFDSLVGFAGGDSISKTTDGGLTWKVQRVDATHNIGIWDIAFADARHGWAVGDSYLSDSGLILSSSDSGKSWQYVDSLTDVGCAIYFTDSLHGYITGSNPPVFAGMIKVTSDGGRNWVTQYLPSSWLSDIAFTDDTTGWVVGDYGYIWHTTDRGLTWNQVEGGTTKDLHRIFFFEHGAVGYILGDDSTLLRYERPVSVEVYQPELKSAFRLFPSYPNPFNATTRISFELPEDSWVSLTLYDILGKEVITFVQEERTRGIHRLAWDGNERAGRQVSSGVYFLRLQAGGYHQVQRLILMR